MNSKISPFYNRLWDIFKKNIFNNKNNNTDLKKKKLKYNAWNFNSYLNNRFLMSKIKIKL